MEKRPAAWLWVVALVPTLWVVSVRWSAGQGMGAEDYAGYILHARALVDGRPYGDTGYIFSRVNPGHGPRLMMPGVPLVLSLVFGAVGETEAAIRITMFALSLGFVLLAGFYFIRTEASLLGYGVTMLIGLSPGIVMFASQVQSDLPFCLAVWAVFALADGPGEWSWGRITAIAMAGIAAIAFRLVGVVLLPSLLIVALLRWKELRWRVLVPLGVWTTMIVGAALVMGLPNLVRNPQWIGLRQLLHHVPNNATTYRVAVGDALNYPFPWDRANDMYHVVALLLVAIGLAVWVRGATRRLVLTGSLVYGAVLMILPFGQARYLWPLFPVILFGLLRGVLFVAESLWPAAATVVTGGAAIAIAAGSIGVIASSARPGDFATVPAAQELFAELRRLDAQTPMRVAFVRPRILALETGIPAMPKFRRPPEEV